MRFKRVDEIVSWRLCMGCGACKYACANNAIKLVDFLNTGIRPVVDEQRCQQCSNCVTSCPGINVCHEAFDEDVISELTKCWGPVFEIWQGRATDPNINFMGSSGGVATAIALFCLEKGLARFVLHIGCHPENSLTNIPVFSQTKAELLAASGSRYAPAAPCQNFDWIENSDYPCVFIGKPCDVAALRKAQKINPKLKEKVFLAISIFCAGTPTTKGTHEILKTLGVKAEEVESLRYRGCGWPGMTSVQLKGQPEPRKMSYEESWGNILSKNGQLRCRLCPDGTGEFADISCGDPWYKKVPPEHPGLSMILVRTKKTKHLLQDVVHNNYLELSGIKANTIALSQKGLLKKRQNLWGRLLVMKLMGVRRPDFKGFSLASNWRDLSVSDKIRSLLGTLRRILFRKWFKPVVLKQQQ